MYIYNHFNDNMNGVPILNVDMATTTSAAVVQPTPSVTNTSNLMVGTATTTPLTPEILNSVMAMTNPLEYSFPSTTTSNPSTNKVSQSADSHSSSSGSPFDSLLATTPAGPPIIVKEATTPTVQQTCSQLIKTSLKLSLEMKRKMSTSDSSSVDTSICKKIKQDIDTSDDDDNDDDDDDDDDEMVSRKPTRSTTFLSPEDEDRRRRRRERNKIAATKCRMKKRERTVNLVSEAETLEAQNIDLKAQVRSLEIERRSLTEMLQLHANSCTRSDGFQIPNINASIMKFLNDIGLQQTETSTTNNDHIVKNEVLSKTRNFSMKTAQKMQKIPSVNTLRFNTRRSNQQTNKLIQPATTIISPVTAAATTRNCINAINPTIVGTMSNMSPLQDCKPLPSIDMGFCEGRNESLTPTSTYCKSLMSSSSDCYAMSSPDSGFIKSPVDMASYSTLPQMIKSDYIPNCDTGMLNDNGAADGSIEFILKSELVDVNDSPYTTVQSADRFLFDGVAETFDPDIETGANSANNTSSLIDTQSHMHEGLKGHMLLQGMNNNNNSSQINNNHHSNLDPNANHNMMHNFGTVNLPVISSVLPPPHSTSIIEFNTSCQQFIDSSLLKGDFLGQNCEFLDSQFTTDLDSGVTTYTNSSGCLA
ncbi:activating transcription factor 3 isoform X2 [Sitodiplosis mosellana]|uniref:activating transcription factor 3 isoform X2 n=1 Tax=Sitodiplosis mosellana TaxID=263140 RepID=UPI002444AD87|nr:activating transcription factor 3 isoform X2 [Sitodiplosis mosellana]XP_055302441.1 activating transcription factor 3 isoform X2 [Sitodiplosis mosellana]